MTHDRFHLATPVTDLAATRCRYVEVLRCRVGRESPSWIDFHLFGHQVTAHLSPEGGQPAAPNRVDGHDVPVRHFDVILNWSAWHTLADHLTRSGIAFLIEPPIRFRGAVGEHATMFLLDSAGNGGRAQGFSG